MATSDTIADRADFSHVRYAQCWEDADVLSAGLAVGPGDRVLSIASAGDNALALLADDPAEVVAIDLSPAQLACLALRIAAFRTLDHAELLELVGSRPSTRRSDLYRRCRPALDAADRQFWDARPSEVAAGIGSAGRFERYFRLFRHVVLPLAHPRRRVRALLMGGGTVERRRQWYDRHWDTARWRALFGVAASRFALGRARDPRFFDHVEGRVADRIRGRVREVVTETDPAANPYLQWILTGTHGEALPRYLRPEHFGPIRDRLDRLVWRQSSLEDVLAETDAPFSQFNLSDVFEYMDAEHAAVLFERVAEASRPGARVAYWNLLADRRPAPNLADRFRPLKDLSASLHLADKAPFYSAFRVDEVVA